MTLTATASGSARTRLMPAEFLWTGRVALAGLALTMAACLSPEPPVVNAAPIGLVRVHGTASPSLTIRVSTQYVTTAKSCRLKGAAPSVPSSEWVESSVTREGASYEATVTLDHFQQDDCSWQPFAIAFQVTNQQGLSTGRFITDAGGTELVP